MERRPSGSRLVEYGLMVTIVLGSLALWIAVPIGSLWVASHVSDNATTVLLATLIICPLAMLAFGLLLAMLHRTYLRTSGRGVARGRSAWLGSLSGDRAPRRGPRPVLETSLAISAGVAFVLLLVFFFFFAENYSPGGLVP
jgi:hypothetical protein